MTPLKNPAEAAIISQPSDPELAQISRTALDAAAEGAGMTVARGRREADGVTTWSFDSDHAFAGRRVRHAFVNVLRALGYADDARFCAELVFGELLGNVVRHAPGRVEIRLESSTPDAVVLHVLDAGRGFSHSAKGEDAFAESGRGLGIIERLVDDFSVRPRTGSGSHVRAVLSRGADVRRATTGNARA